MATRENWERILQTNRTVIQRLIALDEGLEGALRKSNVFTKREIGNIWPKGQQKTIDRVEKLLQMLEKKSFEQFRRFCEALKENCQDRLIADALSGLRGDELDGPVPSPAAPDSATDLRACCPLSPTDYTCMKWHWNDIVENMIIDADVIGKLTEKRLFTDFQIQCIKECTEGTSRNEAFLHLLEKSSKLQYDTFCDIMGATQQLVIRRYLRPFANHSAASAISEVDNRQVGAKVRGEEDLVRTSGDLKQLKQVYDLDKVEMPDPIQPPKKEYLPKYLLEKSFGVCSPEFLKTVEENVRKEIAYKCDSVPRGRAIIINNRYFPKMPTRHGAEGDGIALHYLLDELHFDTVQYENVKAEEIMKIAQTESRAEHHKNYDMFALFLLSHGDSGNVYGRDELPVSIIEIVEMFDGKRCEVLLNKPKLFFIQACRGSERTQGVTGTEDSSARQLPPVEKSVSEEVEEPCLTETGASQNLEKPSLTETSASQNLEKPSLTETSASQNLEKPSLTETSGSQNLEKPSLVDTSGPQNLEKPSLTETSGSQSLEKSSLDETSGSQSLEKSSLDETSGSQTFENSSPDESGIAHDLEKISLNDSNDAQNLENPNPRDTSETQNNNRLDDWSGLFKEEDKVESDDAQRVHEKADVVIVNSVVDGFQSFRHADSGSFFVQCLLGVLLRRAHEDDLQSMLTQVFNELHEHNIANQKQMAEKLDRLRRKVYLLPHTTQPTEAVECGRGDSIDTCV